MAIRLEKGQRISLAKEAGTSLAQVFLGLGWGRRTKKGLFGTKEVDVDLDASCLMFEANGQLVDQVWFRQLRSKCQTVQHSGDDRSGGGQADDDNERIQVDLKNLPANVQQLVFTVNSFLADSFKGIPNAFCRLFDVDGKKEIARFNLSLDGGEHTGLVMAKLSRQSGEWEMQAVGAYGEGRTFDKLMPVIAQHL
ncbi:TerD family protein [Nitrococcus mobilis]|uniref:Tellurium resistance protein n=1 Tax=Nitrococcus mobilis Nb-231 TaxID=314278 RepID=A4BT11_9GAMM|nr:TerD family protein [Nitrococcus mobilis]EAR21079.1 tellurium resistance protein [Nitrococcus mobilis Nb-231]